jgi:hypothetical protein
MMFFWSRASPGRLLIRPLGSKHPNLLKVIEGIIRAPNVKSVFIGISRDEAYPWEEFPIVPLDLAASGVTGQRSPSKSLSILDIPNDFKTPPHISVSLSTF